MSRRNATFDFLNGPASEVAPLLLGCILEREIDGKILKAMIVETEAYDQTDAASHSYKGRTERTSVMFGEAGHLYVYFTYGMHYCCNVVVGPADYGSAVLVRAVEPLSGEEFMSSLRQGRTGTEITNGPAKLCQALSIDKSLNGHDLLETPLKLLLSEPLPASRIIRAMAILY
jgi:DNA-3-methyladenine glycosylase